GRCHRDDQVLHPSPRVREFSRNPYPADPVVIRRMGALSGHRILWPYATRALACVPAPTTARHCLGIVGWLALFSLHRACALLLSDPRRDEHVHLRRDSGLADVSVEAMAGNPRLVELAINAAGANLGRHRSD